MQSRCLPAFINKVFVDIVVTACIENDRAIELQNVLGSIDSSLNLVRHYLIGMCNWLSLIRNILF